MVFRIYPGPDSFPQLAVNELQCNIASLAPDFRNKNSWMNRIFQGVCGGELKARVQAALQNRITEGVQTLTNALNLLSSSASAMHGDNKSQEEEESSSESSSSASGCSDSGSEEDHIWDRGGVLDSDGEDDSSSSNDSE